MRIPITSVSAVRVISSCRLNLAIQTLVGLFPGVIVSIPPHTQNISGKIGGSMLKKIILLLSLIGITIGLQAQAMSLTTGNIWCYQWESGPDSGTYTITAIGDTLINNQSYEILYRESPYVNHIIGFFRSDSTHVYKKVNNSSEYILYNLNWELGQQITIKGSIYTVIDTGYMNFLGVTSVKPFITIYTGCDEDWTTYTYSDILGEVGYEHDDFMSQFGYQSELIGSQIDGIIYGSIENPGNIVIPPNPILNQNFPNPFNPSTTFEFSIPNESKVELAIYNIKGQIIKTIVNNEFIAGIHSIIWNGDDENNNSVSSGIYYYKLNINGRTEAVRKCLLLK